MAVLPSTPLALLFLLALFAVTYTMALIYSMGISFTSTEDFNNCFTLLLFLILTQSTFFCVHRSSLYMHRIMDWCAYTRHL